MAESDNNPSQGVEVDPSEDPGQKARASAPGQAEGDDAGDSDKDKSKDEPGASGKGINPVQHSE